MVELSLSYRPMGQMQLFGSTDTLNKNIIFPGDPRWWDTMERWEVSYAIAYDCETRPLGRGKKAALNPWKNAPRLHQVGIEMPDGTVNVLMVDTDAHPDYQESKFFKLLHYFATSPDRFVLIQNGMFDFLCWRVWYGWRVRSVFDCFVASNLRWAGLPVKHNLEAQCERVTAIFNKFMEVSPECNNPVFMKKWGIYNLPIDKTEQTSDWGAPVLTASQLNYAARDVEVLFPLARYYMTNLAQQQQIDVMWVEMRFLPALVEMEFNGLPLDVELLSQYQAQYQEAYDRYYVEVNKVWKAYSPDVFGTIIQRSDMKVDSKSEVPQLIEDITGKKYPKADKQVLLQLGEQYPVFKTLSLCRTLKKSLDKFKAIDKGKRLHPTGLWVVSGAYKQFSKSAGDEDDGEGGDDYGAGTGRTGSGAGTKGAYLAPNLQNIPTQDKLPDDIKALGLRSIRECFCVPARDNGGVAGCFYIHDLAAAHARIAAYLSGDALMKWIYEDEKRDAHAITVTKLIKFLENYDPATMTVDESAVKEAKALKGALRSWLQELLVTLRNVGKNFYYSCLNDGGAFVLYRLFQSSGLDISMEGCEAALVEYFQLYHGLGRFLASVREDCATPPLDFPEDIRTIRTRSKKSRWWKYGDDWYYRVQPTVQGVKTRQVNRKVRIRPAKAGGMIALGPKPADVLSATWLGIEATAMKLAGALVYEWLCKNPQVEFYLGAITHDELDGWSLAPEPLAAEVIIEAMDTSFGAMVNPIPAGPPTKPADVIGYNWSDK